LAKKSKIMKFIIKLNGVVKNINLHGSLGVI